MLYIDNSLLKIHIIPTQSLSWLKKNPYLTLTAFDANDRSKVLAYISLLPLPEQVILEVLRHERTETDIRAEEIETYDREGGYILLAEGAVAHPDHAEQLSAVLRRFVAYWCDQYPQRYIEKIYAQAATEKGDVLIQKLYFAPLYHLADDAYLLDLRRKGASKIIKHYQTCIEQKQHSSSVRLKYRYETTTYTSDNTRSIASAVCSITSRCRGWKADRRNCTVSQ